MSAPTRETVSPDARASVLIRHIGGSKINQVEKIQLKDLRELTIGRDQNSTIAFDPQRDDVVSRNHAVIRVQGNGNVSFRIADLKSSNGTFLNGELISGEVELLPEDTIELGESGPKFTFDLQPRPAHLAARTRTMGAMAATATHAAAGATSGAGQTSKQGAPGKAGVGRETVMRLMSDERKSTNRVWIAATAGVLALVVIGGGLLYRNNQKVATTLQQQTAEQGSKLRNETSSTLAQQLGVTAGDIVTKFGDSTVWIEFEWKLYDTQTSRPIFHKTFNYNGELLPAYVKLSDGSIVRWLTLDDDDRTNVSIGGAGTGTGFVVSENGFVLTNKHVAAGWMVKSDPPMARGLLFPLGLNTQTLKERDAKRQLEVIDLNSGTPATNKLLEWIPESDGGLVFNNRVAIPTGDGARKFNGHDQQLAVRFPGSRTSINATLIRTSGVNDVAQIKIESPQPLKKVDIAPDDTLKVGERVIVLGYPGVSISTIEITQFREAGAARQRQDFVPEPTVTEGIISRLGTEARTNSGVTQIGTLGDAIQLSINSAGQGNSGGPVFNASGKVIGLFTYTHSAAGANVTLAVPIKYAREFMQSQRLQ
jgi:serine protease Do